MEFPSSFCRGDAHANVTLALPLARRGGSAAAVDVLTFTSPTHKPTQRMMLECSYIVEEVATHRARWDGCTIRQEAALRWNRQGNW